MSVQLELPVSAANSHQEDTVRDLSTAAPAPRALRINAAARLRAAAVHREERAKLTPEQIVDRRTSLADAQIALSVARGVALDDIDPFSGSSMSRGAYEACRHSWISLIKFHGFNDEYDQPSMGEALAWWAERRPQHLDGDDWLAAGRSAHSEYWQGIGHGCGAPYCEVHGETSE